jgi:glycosyltransferase involved in cell wall biosynthesis
MIISMTTYNRYEYLEKSLASLMKTNWPSNTELVINDDASDDPKVIKLLEGLKPERGLSKIHLRIRDKNVGVTKNCTDGIKYCFSELAKDDQFILLTNSDALYNPDWITMILYTHKLLLLEELNVGAITAFNMEYEKKYPYGHRVIGRTKGGARIKESVGGLGVMINRYIFENMTTYENGWDCRYTDKCWEHGFGIYATPFSFVQHIGEEGLHTLPDGRFDNAKDWVGE